MLDRITMVSFQLSIVLFTIFGSVQFLGINPITPHIAHAAPVAPAAPQTIPLTNYYYQANFSEVQSIVNYPHNFPEHQSNWCGMADLQANIAYAWWEVGKSSQNPDPTQESVYSLLNSSSAVSPWGRAVQGYNGPGPYLSADIAADGGTDPRSIAWGLYTATPDPYYDHNYIYTGSYPGGNSVDHATRNFASDYGIDGLSNPITVVVNGGLHLVMVSGVQANGDPSVSPNGVTLYDVLVWDPWYGNTNFGSPRQLVQRAAAVEPLGRQLHHYRRGQHPSHHVRREHRPGQLRQSSAALLSNQ